MGLKLGSTGALVVNDRMQTSMDGVYAAGDVVEVPQNLTGVAVQGLTGSHAMQQGRVAGANAGGGDRRYDPVNIPWGMVGGQIQIGGASFGEHLARRSASRTSSAPRTASAGRGTSPACSRCG